MLGRINILDRSRKRLEATTPKYFGWSACLSGLACMIASGVYLMTKGRGFDASNLSQDPLERFQGLWIHYLSAPQAVLGVFLALFGSALVFRKNWGRQGLLGLIRLVFLLLFALTPAMGYAFFLFFRDKMLSTFRNGAPSGLVFGYAIAIVFGAWFIFVAISMFWWVALAAKRLQAPDYRAWTSSSAPNPK